MNVQSKEKKLAPLRFSVPVTSAAQLKSGSANSNEETVECDVGGP